MADTVLWFLQPFRLPSDHAHSIQILNTCRALAGEGVTVRLMVQRNPNRPVSGSAEALAAYGLEPHPKLVIDWLPTTHKGITGLVARWRIRRARGNPVFYARHLRLAVRAAKRGPVIVELHKMEKEAEAPVRAAAGVVTITSPLRDVVRQEWNVSVPMEVIPDAVDLSVFRPVTGNLSPRVVYTGQFHNWKGVDVLIRALAKVPDLPALIIGGRGGEDPLRDGLKELAKKEGVADRVEWTGYLPQKEIPSLLRTGDIGVVPTRALNGQDVAASPLKLFEYLASGLAVVATDLPSIRDVIRDGENGILFPDGDADGLAAALKRGRDEYGKFSGQAAEAFSWSARAKRILSFLGKVR